MRVCVIGAGVVGVTSAYFLARQGMTWCWSTASRVLRKFPVTPTAASSATATSRRWPGRGAASVPGWLLRSDSPLRFRPRLDPHQWRWCLQFALACRASVARASTAELLTLSYLSRDAMHALLAQENLDFGHLKNGKLIAYRSAELLDKARALVAYQAAHGADQQVLDAAQTLALEPALAGMGASLAGAIYAQRRGGRLPPVHRGIVRPPAGHGQCNARCPIRSRACSARAAASWRCRAATATSARTRWCWRPASARALLSPLGHDVPLYPLKGYSLTVPLADDDRMAPAISVTDYERRIVYARVGACCASRRWWTSAAATRRSTRNASRCSSARSTRLPRPGPAPGHSLGRTAAGHAQGQAADRPQPGRRQRCGCCRALGFTAAARVPALSPGRLEGAAHGNVLLR